MGSIDSNQPVSLNVLWVFSELGDQYLLFLMIFSSYYFTHNLFLTVVPSNYWYLLKVLSLLSPVFSISSSMKPYVLILTAFSLFLTFYSTFLFTRTSLFCFSFELLLFSDFLLEALFLKISFGSKNILAGDAFSSFFLVLSRAEKF